MNIKCDMTCKEKWDLALKIVFVGVFTWGVMSTVCYIKSCSAQTKCCKVGQVAPVKQCGINCQKACCKK